MKKKYTYLIVIFLIVASFVAYGRILGNDFVNFDDNTYITENNHIKSGINFANIKWAFTATVSNHWHPLTLLSHTLDWTLFGANASGHHLMSLLLHIGAVLFLFFFLQKTTNSFWPSAFVAALFALHPLRVESVAWAASRKDVLSMFFGMATLYVYAFYVQNRRLSTYLFCLILFALGLLAKPILITLPFVLLLLDYWPLERWQNAMNPLNRKSVNNELPIKNKRERCNLDSLIEKKISAPCTSRRDLISNMLWEKAPFILLAILSGSLAVWAQNKGNGIISLQELPFLKRLSNAVSSYVSYLGKTFWPVDLAVFYPYQDHFPFWQILVFSFLLIGITIVVIYTMKKLPFLFVGWFWYLGTLIPVIGLLQICRQPMADRYTYLPSIGIALILAWGIQLLFSSEEMRRKFLFPAGFAILAILTFLTWKQCGYWKNSIELFNHTLVATKDNYLALNNRGTALGEIGQYSLAIEDFNKAILLEPDYALPYNNRGFAYNKLGQYQRAIENYNEAIRLKPGYAKAYNNRAVVYFNQDNKELGCFDAQKACALGNCQILEFVKGKGYCR